MIKRPATILALLTALNLLNYLDRFVLSAVLPAVQETLDLSNFVGGALATVFLIGYFATSPIFGTLADRGKRMGLIALGIAIWSIATVASGLAQDAATLIVARVFVGIGEASYATIAPTIIDDIAPLEKKGRWLAVFYSATPIGSALGYLVGGFVAKNYGWREAFYVAGGPGILLAGFCLLIQEPERRLAAKKPELLRSLRTLLRVPLYRQSVLGFCAYTFALGGFAYWAPKFLVARFGRGLAELEKDQLGVANFRFGLVTVVAGAVGTALGGWLGDRAAKRRIARALAAGKSLDEEARDREFVIANLRICALASVIGAPFAAAALFSPSPTVFFAFTFVCEVGLFLLSAPINAVILRGVPTGLRAGAMALSIFAIHLLGDLWSPPLIGIIADNVAPTEIHWAMMLVPLGIAVSAIVWGIPPAPGAPAAASDAPV